MKTAQELLLENGFVLTLDVQNIVSIETMLPQPSFCGIYILHFPDGYFYIGQSVEIHNRYVSHCVNYKNIIRISVKQVRKAKEALDNEEIRLIQLFEAHHIPLLNIVHTSITYRSSEFDIIMPPTEQKRWLNDLKPINPGGMRIQNDALRRKYADRYHNQLRNQKYFAEAAEVLRAYALAGLPSLIQGESEYWSCSCLPMYNVYFRISIYWQEVLTVFVERNTLFFSFHLALSPLQGASSLKKLFSLYPELTLLASETWEEDEIIGGFIGDILADADEHQLEEKEFNNLCVSLKNIFSRHTSMQIINHQYRPGGQDQLMVIVSGKESALEVLKDPQFMQGIRLCNLELMRKGRCNWSHNHCFNLADHIFE